MFEGGERETQRERERERWAEVCQLLVGAIHPVHRFAKRGREREREGGGGVKRERQIERDC